MPQGAHRAGFGYRVPQPLPGLSSHTDPEKFTLNESLARIWPSCLANP